MLTHILGSVGKFHVEVEPHALWRSGNWKYLNDEEFDVKSDIVERIKSNLAPQDGMMLLEKSPINVLRPELVYATFPHAKVIYLNRDPVRCINSNLSRSRKKDSFKLSIVLKKYLHRVGSKDLSSATSERKIFSQISISDVIPFGLYVIRMIYLRNIKNLLPFGPKIKAFAEIVEKKGLIYYHALVYRKSELYKEKYKELYGDQLKEYQFEDILSNHKTIASMFTFLGLSVSREKQEEILHTLDADRIVAATKPSTLDVDILRVYQEVCNDNPIPIE